jgi:hypothetical protein
MGYHNECKVMLLVVASTEANASRKPFVEIIGPRQSI